jgi:hypothetical protein
MKTQGVNRRYEQLQASAELGSWFSSSTVFSSAASYSSAAFPSASLAFSSASSGLASFFFS